MLDTVWPGNAILNLTPGEIDFERISYLIQRGYSVVLVSKGPIARDVIDHISWLTASDVETFDFDRRSAADVRHVAGRLDAARNNILLIVDQPAERVVIPWPVLLAPGAMPRSVAWS